MIVCAALFAAGRRDLVADRSATTSWSRERAVPRAGRRLAYVDRSGRHSAVAATAVLLVGRIHVDLLRVCASRCPGC